MNDDSTPEAGSVLDIENRILGCLGKRGVRFERIVKDNPDLTMYQIGVVVEQLIDRGLVFRSDSGCYSKVM